MYTLYGYKASGAAAVEAALARAGAPYRIVEAATWAPDSQLAELIAVNPMQQIPTLRTPEGDVLTESAAILIALGLDFPDSGLLPPDARARNRSIRGLVYIAANLYSQISIIDYPERWLPESGDAERKRLVQGARARLHRHWELFADQFGQAPFLDGAAPGALDILAAVVSKWSGARAHLEAVRSAFHATLQRIDREPWIAGVFARHWAAAVEED
jgi:GST-like protein